MSLRHWEELIDAARGGDNDAGRKVLWLAASIIKSGEALPEPLREYLSEVLAAAATASTSPSQENFIGDVLNVKLPIGTTPFLKEFEEARDCDMLEEALRIAREQPGSSVSAIHIKLVAKKLGMSEKTARRRIQRYESALAHMGQIFGIYNPPYD